MMLEAQSEVACKVELPIKLLSTLVLLYAPVSSFAILTNNTKQLFYSHLL